MSLLGYIKKIAAKRMMKVDALFTYPVDKQIEFLKRFPEPKNDLERSYFQYRCQIQRAPRADFWIQNLGSIPLLVLYWIKIPKSLRKKNVDDTDLLFFQNGISDSILPNSITKSGKKIVSCNYEDALLLTREDRAFLRLIWKKHPFDFYFLLKILVKVAAYSAQMSIYNPKEFLVSSEYSFTSSILTQYVEFRKCIHTNIMHGEKLFTISDAFVRFSRFIVWDEHYIQLFSSLRADKSQFQVEIPPALRFRLKVSDKRYYLKYYLSDESETDLIRIAELLKKLAERGKAVAVRPHPRFSDINMVKQIFNGIEIEYKTVDIEESILSCEYVAALFSTVLNQAYFNGIKIVIDDYSNPEKYEKLKQMNYLMMSKEHEILSNIVIR